MKTRYLMGLPFAVIGINSSEVEALIDTGFNGALLLPLETINGLGLERIGWVDYAMADGSVVQTGVFSARVKWLDKEQDAAVVATESDFALIGMELLAGARTLLEPASRIIEIVSVEKAKQ
jgi:clan AA aspartic protease